MKTPDRLFLDTVYFQALLDKFDQHHAAALKLLPSVEAAREAFVTEAVLLEVGNALSRINRTLAADLIQRCYVTESLRVVAVDTTLFLRGIHRYKLRPDKGWSLTDCISFVVMEDEGLTDAVTSDHHFEQAGFHALMIDSPN